MSVKKTFITVPLDKLIPYENNPRINEPAIPDTIESIKQCENLDPIEIDEGFVILSGHTRLAALQQLGYTETEVVQYEGLTEEQKRKYRILANKTGEEAEWDFSKLEQELADLDFSDFSFDFDDVEQDDKPTEDQKGSMREKYLVPPFSVIYGNKPDWLERKRRWVKFGIMSEQGRGGDLCFSFPSGWRDNHPLKEVRADG